MVGRESGAGDYLAKPFNPRELVAGAFDSLAHAREQVRGVGQP